MLKISIVIILFFIVGFSAFKLGFWISSVNTESIPSPLAKTQTQDSDQPVSLQSPSPTPSPAPSTKNFRKLSAEDGLSKNEMYQKYLKLVEEHHLENKSKELLSAFPKTDTGRTLAYAATFFLSGPASNTPEGSFANEQLKNIRNDPYHAVQDLKDGLAHLGPEYHHERLFLTQIVSDTNIDLQSKMELLSLQFRKTVAEQSLSDSEITLRVMTSEISDASLIEPLLRETLSKSSDTKLNLNLLAVFERRFPEQAKQMKQDLGL